MDDEKTAQMSSKKAGKRPRNDDDADSEVISKSIKQSMMSEPSTDSKRVPMKMKFRVSELEISHSMLWNTRMANTPEHKVVTKEFTNQKAAYNYWKAMNYNGVVYTKYYPYREGASEGCMKFIVDGIAHHFQLVQNKIQQGRKKDLLFNEQMPNIDYERGMSAVPMHIDLDLHTCSNPKMLDGTFEIMEPLYISNFVNFMAANLGLDPQDISTYISDSTKRDSEGAITKISRHYVMRMCKDGVHIAFASNRDCGALVRHYQRYINKTCGPPGSPTNHFYFRGESDDGWEFHFDQSVYSQGRSMRETASSKAKAYRPLVPVGYALEDLDWGTWLKYSILTPDPPPSTEAKMRLFMVEEVDGGRARSRQLPSLAYHVSEPKLVAKDRAVRTRHAAVWEAVDADCIDVSNIFVPDNWQELCKQHKIKWRPGPRLWGTEDRMNGRSLTPVVAKDVVGYLMTCIKHHNVEPWNADESIGVQYYDFNVRSMRLSFTTKGNWCGLLYHRTKKLKISRFRHKSQNSVLVVDITAMTWWWECWDPKCIVHQSNAPHYSLTHPSMEGAIPKEKRDIMLAQLNDLATVFDTNLCVDLNILAAPLMRHE